MRLWPFLCLAGLAWFAGSAPAPAADGVKSCTSETAESATIAEVQGDFERWRGRCVRLSGLVAQRRLHVDRAALAESPSQYGSAPSRSIVVYPEGPGQTPAPGMAEVVGTIGSCELHHSAAAAAQAEEPGSIVWASGYCHTSTETYIRPVAINRLSDRAIVRLMEIELPPDSRPWVEAPQDTPGLVPHVTAARAMAAAIVGRDRSAFLSLSDPDLALDLAGLSGNPTPGPLRTRLRENRKLFAAQTGRRGLFAALHPVAARQERVLVDRGDLADTAEIPLAHAITCWCREPDCTGRWPMLAADADNTKRRPYACVRTNDYLVHKKGSYIQADASRRPGPFAEP